MEDHQKNQDFVRQMMQALEHKRAEAEAVKAAEKQFNKEYIKVC